MTRVRYNQVQPGIGIRRHFVVFSLLCLVLCKQSWAESTGRPELTADELVDEETSVELEPSTEKEPKEATRTRVTTTLTARSRLSDGAELDRIIELYMAGDYQKCSTELGDFLASDNPDRFSDPNVVERGRLYFATCSLLLGNREEARQSLRSALEENPLMPSPDSLTFPPPVVSLFLEVRDEVQQLIADREREQVLLLRRENEIARRKVEERRRREEQLEQLASEETVLRKNSRFIAALPLGAGQFQNGNVALGTVFLVGQSVAIMTSVTALAINQAIISRAKRQRPDADRYERQTQALYQTMKWSFYSALGLYALSVLEAQLSFKSEIKLESRKRELPPELSSERPVQDGPDRFSLSPAIAPLDGGVYFGIDGTF